MEFKTLVSGRRSIRAFKQESIPEQDIIDIIKIAGQAPSAGNRQMWRFTVVTNREKKELMRALVLAELERIAEVTNTPSEKLHMTKKAISFFADAPVVILISTELYSSPVDKLLRKAGYQEDEIERLRCRPDLQSIGAVIQTLLLAAYEKGYGTCWLTGPMVARPQLEELYEIKPPRSLAAIVAMGAPAKVPVSPPRLPVEEIISFIR